jgi:DNA-binding Xre family transcriptional regulator
MRRKMTIRWNLRKVMADQGMFATSDLVPLLAERGVSLSREQVYRLVTQTPERLNMAVLAALCDALGVGVTELIEVVAEPAQVSKAAGGRAKGTGAVKGTKAVKGLTPTRARIVPDKPS